MCLCSHVNRMQVLMNDKSNLLPILQVYIILGFHCILMCIVMFIYYCFYCVSLWFIHAHSRKRGEVMYHLAKNDVNFTPLIETEDIGYLNAGTMPSQPVHEPSSHSSFAIGNGHLQDHSNEFPLQPRGYSSPYINISKTRGDSNI